MVLSPADDYPLHQSAAPIAHPVSGDLNHYDRYFFNGYDADASLFFAAALGVYPNRQVIDGAFSVVRDGVQRSVLASGRLPLDRRQTTVGPVTIEVVEPLRTLRLVVDDPASGLGCDLVFEARSAAWEEPRFTRHQHGTRLIMDYTRLTQWGRWRGSVEVDGERIDVSPDRFWGSRDRSWGVRRVGEPEAGMPGGAPQFHWLWAPLNLPERALHLAINELADGTRWYESGVVLDDVGDGATWGTDAAGEAVRAVDVEVAWQPGTRWIRSATLRWQPWAAEAFTVELEPRLHFLMHGLGYLHPEAGHGHWRGDEAVHRDVEVLADVDPSRLENLHVQTLVGVAASTGERGVGVLEQLVIGPHLPTGLTGITDPAA